MITLFYERMGYIEKYVFESLVKHCNVYQDWIINYMVYWYVSALSINIYL